MTITKNNWKTYIKRLSQMHNKAGQLMRSYIDTKGTEDLDALLTYANQLISRYGQAAAELACEMYDATANASKANVPDAVPASLATQEEINGSIVVAQQKSDYLVPQMVERFVKLAGQDTTMQNAIRDGAEWAWVPSGDTCAFCITLASNGWQRASRKTMKGNHAQHIHANCDCSFMVRFNDSTEVEGYDPEGYYDQYKNAEGNNWRDKVNAMRRESYQANKDSINARKREIYANKVKAEAE